MLASYLRFWIRSVRKPEKIMFSITPLLYDAVDAHFQESPANICINLRHTVRIYRVIALHRRQWKYSLSWILHSNFRGGLWKTLMRIWCLFEAVWISSVYMSGKTHKMVFCLSYAIQMAILTMSLFTLVNRKLQKKTWVLITRKSYDYLTMW